MPSPGRTPTRSTPPCSTSCTPEPRPCHRGPRRAGSPADPRAHTEGTTMSNHFSAASLKPPGGDPRLDFTDLYAFISPEDPDKTLVIMDSDPFLLAPAFHPDAVYRLDVDTDGDARPDIAFSFVFSALDDGAQTATACYATGGQAHRPDAVGNVLVAGAPVGFDDTAQPVHARG